MAFGLMLLTGFLAAMKATEDLGAFRPGRLRLADLMVLVVSLIVLMVVDLGLALTVKVESPETYAFVPHVW